MTQARGTSREGSPRGGADGQPGRVCSQDDGGDALNRRGEGHPSTAAGARGGSAVLGEVSHPGDMSSAWVILWLSPTV